MSEMSMLYESDPALDPLFHAERQKRRVLDEREKRVRDALILAAREVLKTENGKRLLCWLLGQTGVFTPCFTGNSATFFLEGKRAVGLEIYRLLMAASHTAIQDIINFNRSEDSNAK